MAKLRSDFVEELLLEKERFGEVTKKSNGSICFKLQTGETLGAEVIPDEDEFGEGEGHHFVFKRL